MFYVTVVSVDDKVLTFSLQTYSAVLYSTRVSSAGEPAIGINAMDKSVYLLTESERVNPPLNWYKLLIRTLSSVSTKNRVCTTLP